MMEVGLDAVTSLWNAAFGDEERPEVYLDDSSDSEGFPPLNDPQKFTKDIDNFPHLQLYALAANNQLALKATQDEYLIIDKLVAEIRGKDTVKNPQALPSLDTLEERKESQLYGYKYEANKPALINHLADEISEREKQDVRLFQEPFEQGGFVPKERQYKAMLFKAKDLKNVDGWTPIQRDGKRLIPRQQVPHEEYRRPVRHYDDDDEFMRPVTAESMDSLATPSKPLNKRLTRTRYNGHRYPPTREPSEAPSVTSTPRGKRSNTPKPGSVALGMPEFQPSPEAKRRKLQDKDQQGRSSPSPIKPGASQPGQGNGVVASAVDPLDYYKFPSHLSAQELRLRKWEPEELRLAVRYDHTWLNDDQVQAREWKEKIIPSKYPIRTYSMLKKWAFWTEHGQNKRPRNGRKVKESEPPEPLNHPGTLPVPV